MLSNFEKSFHAGLAKSAAQCYTVRRKIVQKGAARVGNCGEKETA